MSDKLFNKISTLFPESKIKKIDKDIYSFVLQTDHGEIEFAKFDKFYNKKGHRVSFGFDSPLVISNISEYLIFQHKLPIISLDALIVLKLFLLTKRQKDYDDVQKILKYTKNIEIPKIIKLAKMIDVLDDIYEVLCFLEK
ncbi:MAG: hypothetical protein N3A71_03645 [Candidatus Dojkabacteria bacterium]|nr:hypothetical protein [Candidatus Dojkabacteria bacterium]